MIESSESTAEFDLLANPVGDAVATFDPIGLAELDALASLQARRDRKYVLDLAVVPAMVAATDANLRVLTVAGETATSYQSTYFETPDHASYLGAARSRPNRWKVRVRRYGDDPARHLEVKVRTPRGDTVKDRIDFPPRSGRFDPDRFNPDSFDPDRYGSDRFGLDAYGFLGSFDMIRPHLDRLAPVLVTGYDRTTLHCVDDDMASGQRITIDTDLRCALPDGTHVDVGHLSRVAIIETKSPGDRPGPFDRALWRARHRPLPLSKFAVGMVCAHPDLPHNKWHRTLQRHVLPRHSGASR